MSKHEPKEEAKSEKAEAAKEPEKSVLETTLALYANGRGEHDWAFEQPEAKKFTVHANGGALVDPESRKPLIFDNVDDAQAVALSIASENPLIGVRVHPLY